MQVDLFGNLIVEEPEYSLKINKKNPFDYTKDIGDKTYPDDFSGYNAWLTNSSFSQRNDTVFHANEINKYHRLGNKEQFDFYYYSLPKKKYFAKWAKASKIEHIDSICAYYDCSEREAMSYIKVLKEDQLTQIIQWFDQSKGGSNDSRSSNVHGTKSLPRSKR